MTSDCATGLACAPAFDGGSQQCQKTCTTDANCSSPGGACINLTTGKHATVCTANCDPATNAGCLPGDSCRLFSENQTTTSASTYCGGTGTKGQGKSCTTNGQCVTDYGCAGFGDCERICDPNNDTCPGIYSCTDYGTALGGTEVGFCE